jgi:hypothetical protein
MTEKKNGFPDFTSYQDRVANLKRHINNGTLIQKDYGDGYAQACLLSALAPEVCWTEFDDHIEGEPHRCPDDVMPEWFAHVTPTIDDYVSMDNWDAVIRQYAQLSARWRILTEDDWNWVAHTHLILMMKVYRGYQAEGQTFVEEMLDIQNKARANNEPWQAQKIWHRKRKTKYFQVSASGQTFRWADRGHFNTADMVKGFARLSSEHHKYESSISDALHGLVQLVRDNILDPLKFDELVKSMLQALDNRITQAEQRNQP